MNSKPLTIMLVAVEPSADQIGASVLRELKKRAPKDTRFFGCGGPAMAAEGFESDFPIEPFSVMGFTDVAMAAPLAFQRARELAEKAAADYADIAVLIDGWAFSRIAATRLRKLSPETTLIKLVAPQIWASRPKRVNFVKKYFDGVLALFPFEPPLFENAGVKCAFIGNPNFQSAFNRRGDGEVFRKRHDLGAAPLLAILLGSRKREVSRLAKPFREAVDLLAPRIMGLRIVTIIAPSVAAHVGSVMAGWPGSPVFVGPEEKYDAMAAANVALVKSGTASTELAINRTPMVVAYRVDPVTALWAQRVKTTPFASILNVAADRYVIPEFIQDEATGLNLAGAVNQLFEDASAYVEQAATFDVLLKELGVDGAPAEEIAAEKILEWKDLGKKRVKDLRLTRG